MSYPIGKLKRSLIRRVRDRVSELLPGSEVSFEGDETVHIRYREMVGSISIAAMAAACHADDRANWGAIAGSFCSLVVSRVNAHFEPPLSDDADLDRVFPVVQPAVEADDRLIEEATPLPDLLVVTRPWLEGIRLEFDYATETAGRRVFQRDLVTLGVDAEEVERRALKHLAAAVASLPVAPLTPDGVGARVLGIHSEGYAPAVLRTPEGQTRLFAALAEHGVEGTPRVLACAPRTDQLLFCSIRDRAAASAMVAAAWALFEGAAEDSLPLSPRLYSVPKSGAVGFLDVGIGPDRLQGWERHELGPVAIYAPAGWLVSEQDGRRVVWPGTDGPRVRVNSVASGGGSPLAASRLAERVRAKHGLAADIGYGFFNGCPWAWVDTGLHDGHQTASMFVVAPSELVVMQTEIPEGTERAQAMMLQKIMATVHLI